MVIPFEELAAEGTAEYYDSLDTSLPYEAIPAEASPTEQLSANARWALRTGHGEKGLRLLEASAERQLYNVSRRTVRNNAQRESGATWARLARADTDCDFCKMLATRGNVYASQAKAVGVAGDRYHDGCHCLAVPVRPGGVYRSPSWVQKWDEEASWAR